MSFAKLWLSFALSALTLGLYGCASTAPAPEKHAGDARVVEAPRSASMPPSEAPPPAAPKPGPNEYMVKKGDTLYAIALDHGVDYKDLARWNRLDNPNRIEVGQILAIAEPKPVEAPPGEGVVVTPIVAAAPAPISLDPATKPAAAAGETAATLTNAANTAMLKRGPKGGKVPYSEAALAHFRSAEAASPAAISPSIAAGTATAAATVAGSAATVAPTTVPATAPAVAAVPAAETPVPAKENGALTWRWPSNGKVLGGFVDGGNKGLDIAGTIGDPVLAAAPGKVSYVGSSLRGYGKMVVVKHSGDLLSVYAHNSKVLVAEGQSVASGQKIAELGDSDTDAPKLHFEIRKQGKPINPLGFLPER